MDNYNEANIATVRAALEDFATNDSQATRVFRPTENHTRGTPCPVHVTVESRRICAGIVTRLC